MGLSGRLAKAGIARDIEAWSDNGWAIVTITSAKSPDWEERESDFLLRPKDARAFAVALIEAAKEADNACEYCGKQWSPEHDCYGTRGEGHHARMMDEAHQ